MARRHHPALHISILVLAAALLLPVAVSANTATAGVEGFPRFSFPTPGGAGTPDPGSLPPGFSGFTSTPAPPGAAQAVTVEGPANPVNLVEIDAPAGDTLTLDPVVTFQDPPLGELELLAGFYTNGKFYLAQEWPTGVVFEALLAGAPLVGFGSHIVEAAPFVWAPDVFDNLGAVDLEIVTRRQVIFFLAIMPAGQVDQLQVGAFLFK